MQPKKFRAVPGYAHTRNSHKILQPFRTDYSSMCTRFPAIFDLSFRWGLRTSNLGEVGIRGRGWYRPKDRALASSYNPSIQIIALLALVWPKFQIGVLGCEPQFWGRGGRTGSRVVPFERVLLSFQALNGNFYSIFTRFRDILPLLFTSMPLFPYPISSLPQISPCSPWSRWIAFWLQKAKMLGQPNSLCNQFLRLVGAAAAAAAAAENQRVGKTKR